MRSYGLLSGGDGQWQHLFRCDMELRHIIGLAGTQHIVHLVLLSAGIEHHGTGCPLEGSIAADGIALLVDKETHATAQQ